MTMKLKISSIVAYASLVIVLLQLVLIVVSWILTAVNPELRMRSILGSEGLRWLFGSYVSNVASSFLVWMIVMGMSVGPLIESGLSHSIVSYKDATGYERMALFVALWELLAIIVVVVFLAFVPHAVLLSALGTLMPSSFSASAVPLVAVSIGIVSITYGCIVGRFKSVDSVFSAMLRGIGMMSPLIIVYVFAYEFYCSLMWVLCF